MSLADPADLRRRNPKNNQQERSAREHAAYVDTLNLREHTSALADTTKKNISGALTKKASTLTCEGSPILPLWDVLFFD